ncbi:hypothetical protein OAG71_01075 [bacterium]|nr:hypothetical protein [bacterium]
MNTNTLPQSAYQDILGVNPNATLFLAILKLDFIHFGLFVDLYLTKEGDDPIINVIHYHVDKIYEDRLEENENYIDRMVYNEQMMTRTMFEVPERYKPHALEIISQVEKEIDEVDWNKRLDKILDKGAEQLPSQAHAEHQAQIQDAMNQAQALNKAKNDQSATNIVTSNDFPKRKIEEGNKIEGALPETVLQGLKDKLQGESGIIKP